MSMCDKKILAPLKLVYTRVEALTRVFQPDVNMRKKILAPLKLVYTRVEALTRVFQPDVNVRLNKIPNSTESKHKVELRQNI